MSLSDLEAAISLLSANPTRGDFIGPASEELIRRAEQVVGFEFPTTYRSYLSRLGCGAVGANEFYGVLTDDFEHSGVPDAIWVTLKDRECGDIPDSLLVVGSTGYGPCYAIDIAQRNADGESPVIEWWPGLANVEGNGRIVASDFGKFFLELVQESLAGGNGRQDTQIH